MPFSEQSPEPERAETQSPDLTTADGLIRELESITQGWREDFETRDEGSLRSRERAVDEAVADVTIPEESRDAFKSALDGFIGLADNQVIVGRMKELRKSLETPGG
jgi:hypothetical protein